MDDAYITFRYARNLAEGAGLVYNAGERVLGTSAPLFALLLAGLHRLTGLSIPAIAFAVGAACLPLVALLGYRLARRVTGPAFAAIFVAAGLSPRESLRVFSSGMETPLYLLGLLLAVELACRGRDVIAVAVAGMLAFVHPDAVLILPALTVALRVGRGQWPWRALVLGLTPAAAAAAAVSVAAFALILLFGRAALGGLAALAFAGFSAAYVAAFAAANPLLFEWYRPPLALTSTFVVAVCAARVPRTWRAPAAILLAGSFAVHVAAFRPYDPSGREDVYARAAAALALKPEETVVAPEIGAVGWATRARVLDTTGLVSPAALAWSGRPRVEGGSIPPRLLRETDATALVTLDRFLASALAAGPGTMDRWSEVARYPAHAFGDFGTVRVLRRIR